jgi:hypothetical protein
MTSDNVIELAPRRTQVATSRDDTAMDRKEGAATLLEKLGSIARISKQDRAALTSNLGHLCHALDPHNPMRIAQGALLPDQWPKRKRYILLSKDIPEPRDRLAASGSAFAQIIRQLINAKMDKGIDHAHAMTEIVYGALKKTSFLPPSRFQIPENDHDAAYFTEEMEKVVNKLAQATDLAEYFELVAKHPIDPVWPSRERPPLVLEPSSDPNDLYRWDVSLEEEELEPWVPWWAPRCLIGHLYVPFHCGALELSERGIAKLKELCRGEITHENWLRGECSSYEEPFDGATRIDRIRVYHRLPIWLITLPSRTRLVPCLYASAASIDYRYDFQMIRNSLIDGTYFSYIDRITPRFVDTISKGTEADGIYFWGEDDLVIDPQYYVRCTESGVCVIGRAVDGGDIMAEVFDPSWFDDLPEWLQSRPIQKILRLTADSDAATAFALESQIFQGLGFGEDTETYFRPAFPDPVGEHTTPLLQNTIAAYLLRNFIRSGDETVFEALKRDALAKAVAAKELISGKTSKFQEVFDKLYGL